MNVKRCKMKIENGMPKPTLSCTKPLYRVHNNMLSDLYEHMTEALCASVHNLLEITPAIRIHTQLAAAIIGRNRIEYMDVNQYIRVFKDTIHMEDEHEN